MTPPDPPVLIEAVYLRHNPEDGFTWRAEQAPLDHPAGPDATVRALARLHPADRRTIVHSTSWRADADGRIVLTYLIWPDPEPAAPGASATRAIARGSDPAHPTPDTLEPAHVAAHALAHLAWLSGTAPVIAALLDEHPVMRIALAAVAARPAGQLQPA